MIEMVMVFALMNVIFEFVLLGMLPPRTRLRVLGSPNRQKLLHVAFLLTNLMIHWGTLVGSMASIGAFICSIVTVQIAKVLWGYVTPDEVYRRGVLAYKVAELR